jgi:hypothetical protein
MANGNGGRPKRNLEFMEVVSDAQDHPLLILVAKSDSLNISKK